MMAENRLANKSDNIIVDAFTELGEAAEEAAQSVEAFADWFTKNVEFHPKRTRDYYANWFYLRDE